MNFTGTHRIHAYYDNHTDQYVVNIDDNQGRPWLRRVFSEASNATDYVEEVERDLAIVEAAIALGLDGPSFEVQRVLSKLNEIPA